MSDGIQQHRDATLRKIGRNVVNFQKIEVLLRSLVLATSAEGTLSDFQARQAVRTKSLKKSSLGNLAKEFNKRIYGPVHMSETPESSVAGWFSVSLRAEADPVTVKEKKRALSTLVSERNRLIHSDVGSVDLNSVESCILACEKLDAQNERICRQFEEMKVIWHLHIESTRELQAFLDSDEFLKFVSEEQRDP